MTPVPMMISAMGGTGSSLLANTFTACGMKQGIKFWTEHWEFHQENAAFNNIYETRVPSDPHEIAIASKLPPDNTMLGNMILMLSVLKREAIENNWGFYGFKLTLFNAQERFSVLCEAMEASGWDEPHCYTMLTSI